MTFQDYFPIWNKLQTDQQDRIRSNLNFRTVKKGTILHNGDMDCTGLLLVKAGQLRAYILSDEGREITIYRLFDRDLCLFSASCIMRSIQFEVTIQAEKDTDLWVIPAEVYQDIMEASAPVANYTNELMASRFSEVMWLMEQVMWKSLDKRVAAIPHDLTVTLGGVTFFMVHNRKEVPADLAGVDAVVFGHSHKYVQEEKGGVLWLNPGSCGPRRFHQEITMMTAEAEDGKIRVEKVIIPHGTA